MKHKKVNQYFYRISRLGPEKLTIGKILILSYFFSLFCFRSILLAYSEIFVPRLKE